MSEELGSDDGIAELTKAERTARKNVQESVEGVVTSAPEEDGVIAVEPGPVLVAPSITTYPSITTSPNVTVVAGSDAEASVASADDEVTEDLDDASASALVEARRDLT